MRRDKLIINKNQIPCRFSILLGSEVFFLTVDYNKKHDFFTVGLEDNNGDTLCVAEPAIYGVPLWQDMIYRGNFPALRIIPWDESEQENKITWENFGVTTFLYVDNADEPLIG